MKRTLFACMHIMCTHTKYMHTHTNTHKKTCSENHTHKHILSHVDAVLLYCLETNKK